MHQPLFEAPVYYFDCNETGVSEVHETMHCGRSALANLEITRQGFTLSRHRSSVSDWDDLDEINRIHRPEIRTLAKTIAHCDEVVVYPALARSTARGLEEPDHAPIQFVHSDFSEDYRAMVRNPARPYRAFLEPLLKESGLSYRDLNQASRLQVLQFWRNTGPINADFPLALADASKVSNNRLHREVIQDYAGDHLEFETLFIKPPPAQTQNDDWFVFSDLTQEEVIVFRTYDSLAEEEGGAFWTPHCAVQNPHPDAKPRSSVEMRALCVWNP